MSFSGVRLMEPIQAEPVESEPVAEPRPPRLSIFHLLCWTAGTAIVLRFFHEFPQPLSPSPVLNAAYTALVLVYSICDGIPLASLILFGQYAFRRDSVFPRAPGHWLLLSMGLSTLVSWPIFLYVRYVFAGTSRGDFSAEMFANLIQALTGDAVRLAVAAVATLCVREGRWKAVWGVLFAMTAVEALALGVTISVDDGFRALARLSLIHQLLPVLNFVFLLGAAASDVREGVRRDWLHNTGLACSCVICVALSGYYALAWFVTPQ